MKILNLKRKIQKYGSNTSNNPAPSLVNETLLVPITNLDEQELTLNIDKYDNVFRLNTFDASNLQINVPVDSNNFMCYIHIVHRGIFSKQVTFANPLINTFINNTLNSNSSVFNLSANSTNSSFSYITLSMYVHKINSVWNLDFKYNVELTRSI